METKQKKKKKENRFSFLYILGGGILKFHCQAYEDDRACCRTDIHIYR